MYGKNYDTQNSEKTNQIAYVTRFLFLSLKLNSRHVRKISFKMRYSKIMFWKKDRRGKQGKRNGWNACWWIGETSRGSLKNNRGWVGR